MRKIFFIVLALFLVSAQSASALLVPIRNIETNQIDPSVLEALEPEDDSLKTEIKPIDTDFAPMPIKDIKLLEPEIQTELIEELVQPEIRPELLSPETLDKLAPDQTVDDDSFVQPVLKDAIAPVKEIKKESAITESVISKDLIKIEEAGDEKIEDMELGADIPYELAENESWPDSGKEEERELEAGLASFLPERRIELDLRAKKFIINGSQELVYGDSDEDTAAKLDVIKFQIASTSKMSEFKVKPAGDCLDLYLIDSQSDKIRLCAGLKSDEEGVRLVEAGVSARLKTQPDLIYESLKEEAESENAEMGDVELRVVDGRAEYHVNLKERRRFLGLIPIKVGVRLVVDATSDQITNIQYGFIGKLFKKKDYILDFKLLPDLIIVDISSNPKSVRAGEELHIRGRIRNVGNAPSHNPGYGDGRARVILERNGNELTYNYLEKNLNPGEEQMFYFGWSFMTCNTELVIRIDPLNHIEELKEDNNDRLYMTNCAPDQAPDLAVKSITYNNNYKRIGADNTVNFTFINQGPVAAPEYTAFYNYEGKSASILVPPLAPQATWSTSRVIKPERCDPLYLELDPVDTVLETNEDNNIFYEPEDITLACKRRADLLFTHCAPWGKEFLLGEEKSFKCTVQNMTDYIKENPKKHPPNEACLSGFKTSFKVNGQTVASKDHRKIGCRPSDSNYSVDYWLNYLEYKYTPKCNGETVSIVIDPDNSISEGREDNNIWSKTIICAGQLEGAVQ